MSVGSTGLSYLFGEEMLEDLVRGQVLDPGSSGATSERQYTSVEGSRSSASRFRKIVGIDDANRNVLDL